MCGFKGYDGAKSNLQVKGYAFGFNAMYGSRGNVRP